MKTRRGLTLIELTVALAIVSIVSAVAALSVANADRRVLQNASLKLQSDLRYIQRMAMIDGRRWSVMFSDDFYEVLKSEPSGPMTSVRRVNLTDGVVFVGINTPDVVYLPRGTVSSGFSVYLGKGRNYQQLTATVSGGRIEVKDIVSY